MKFIESILMRIHYIFHSCDNNYETVESFKGQLIYAAPDVKHKCIIRKRRCSVCGKVIAEIVTPNYGTKKIDVEWFDVYKNG